LIRPDIHRIALGDPVAVPIGVYAREYLQKAGLWDRIAPKVVPTENVRELWLRWNPETPTPALCT
jgi:ABC-type molybdate transport system substrate-binding protein